MAQETWIVVNIGCIECGVSSDIVGVFTDREAADALVIRLDEVYGWREGGQNAFDVFPMPALNVLNPAYAEAADTIDAIAAPLALTPQ